MFAAVLAVAVAWQPPALSQDPDRIVAAAAQAVVGDSVARVRETWRRSLKTQSDRIARLGLASLDRLTNEVEAANQGYLTIIAAHPDDRIALNARLGLAATSLFRDRFDSTAALARAAMDQAREMGDSATVAATINLIGFLDSRMLGPYGRSLDTLEVALRWAPARRPDLRALTLCTMAPIMSFAGRGEARSVGLRGLALAKEAKDDWVLGVCYHALTMVTTNDSDDPIYPEAYADSAEAVQRRAGDGPGLAITHFSRGYERIGYLNLAGAKEALTEAIAEGIRSRTPFAVAWGRRWRSIVYWQIGDLASADRDLREAERLFTELNDRLGLSNIWLVRVNLDMAAGNYSKAERLYRSGLERAIEREAGEATYYAHVNLALAAMAQERWDEAQAGLDRAVAFGRTHGQQGAISSLQWEYGLLALGQGQLDRAERSFRAYLAGTGPTQYLDKYAARSRLAEVEARRGNLTRAAAELVAATDQLDSLRGSLTDEQLKLMVFQTRFAGEPVDLGFARLAAAFVEGNMSDVAFALAERRRARGLADRLIRAAYLEGDSSSVATTRGRAGTTAKPTTVVGEGEAIVELVAGLRGQPTSLFVLTRDTIRGYVLPSVDSLAPLIRRLEVLVGQGLQVAGLARDLGQIIFDRAVADLDPRIRRLVVVPDDVFHRIPFDVLRLANGEPLIRRFTLSRSPSAAIATRAADPPLVPLRPARILAVGDPRFAAEREATDGSEGEAFREAFAASGGLARLVGSGEEAALVARFAPDPVLLVRDQATEAYIKRAGLTAFRVIHFATHALVDRSTSSRSALALTPGDGEDGFLSAAELGLLHLDADLVVLSACRTAGGTVIGGEGIQGLTAPLLAAGARAVVATLWPVPDQATKRFVAAFYQGLASGLTAGDALRSAKLQAIDRNESPTVWAAFTLVGNGEVRPPLVMPSPRWGRWALAAGLALVVIAVVWRRRS